MSDFPVHSIETAPVAARDRLAAAKAAFGFVPNLLGMLAESPTALEAYLGIGAVFQRSSLSPAEQNVVLLAVSVTNGCHYCVAAHTMIAAGAKVPNVVVEAIRHGQPIDDPKLEAIRRFAEAVVRERGWAEAAQISCNTVIKPTSELGSAGYAVPDDTVGRILKELR